MKLIVTAGPTREPIDPVRYLSNRSSGKMGYALAAAGLDQGHEVTLIAGPTALTPPAGARLIAVTTAADMLRAVLAEFEGSDALIMAAAVADWRPAAVASQKIKKDGRALTLTLEPTEDILLRVASIKGHRIVAGFAAETQDVEAEAFRKLKRKNLDLMIANDVSRGDAGFEVDTNLVVMIDREGRMERLPLLQKTDVARLIVERVARLVEK